jgi:hypothetical protein
MSAVPLFGRPRHVLARPILFVIAVTTFLLGMVGVTSAAAATPVHACVVVVGKAANPDQVSPVLFQYCSTISGSDAMAHLTSPQVEATLGPNAVNSSDLLMTWFEDGDFEGQSTDVFGAAGPCDSAGYRLVPSTFWQTHLSSAAGTSQCNEATFTTRSLTFAETHPLPTNITSTLNDNVGVVHVFDG